ncbi:hypothetical protein [Nocardia nepalensis]|uniref:hypothetical protein n=1 Tax=Nocardia nepalensis TaxID=3375448 RepID=UPI003B66F629
MRAVVANVAHLTYRQQMTRALTDYHRSSATDADTLHVLTGFVGAVLDVEARRQPIPTITPYAGAEAVSPEIRRAIGIVVAEIWDREKDDYRQQDDDCRADHRFCYLTILHTWLGPLSPIH